MRVTQTINTSNLQAQFYFIGAIIEVRCTIEYFITPDLPAETTYLIGSGSLEITLTPEFTQYPSCGFALDEYESWILNPSPAPVLSLPDTPYIITIETDDLSKARV